jgi:hypothetical protein
LRRLSIRAGRDQHIARTPETSAVRRLFCEAHSMSLSQRRSHRPRHIDPRDPPAPALPMSRAFMQEGAVGVVCDLSTEQRRCHHCIPSRSQKEPAGKSPRKYEVRRLYQQPEIQAIWCVHIDLVVPPRAKCIVCKTDHLESEMLLAENGCTDWICSTCLRT